MPVAHIQQESCPAVTAGRVGDKDGTRQKDSVYLAASFSSENRR